MQRWLALVLTLSACGPRVEPVAPAASPSPSPSASTSPSPSPSPSPSTSTSTSGFECEVEVDAYGREVEGSAKGTDPKADGYDKEAWKKVCDALKQGYGIDCGDEMHISKTRLQTIQITNGKVSAAVTYRVRPVVDTLKAAGSSPDDWKTACSNAVTNACKNAPSGSSCDGKSVLCLPGQHTKCAPSRSRLAGATPLVEPTAESMFERD